MIKSKLYPVDEVIAMIQNGHLLTLAGDEKVMSKLPKGNWIGGTIPYFMDEAAGQFSQDLIYVNELSSARKHIIKSYDETNIDTLAKDSFSNGFTVLIIPPFQKIHTEFSLTANDIDGLYDNPIIGWMAGTDLSSNSTPKTFNGLLGATHVDKAVAVHVELPKSQTARLEIINIFKQDVNGAKIEFLENGFECQECLVDGKKTNLAKYLAENNINTKPPISSNHSGAIINVSFKEINQETGTVYFYAPIFKDTAYHFSLPVNEYVKDFESKLPEAGSDVAFSCNCILNYLYGELEGKSIKGFTGPITFGEIGYVILNQTLTYLVIEEE
jgi:hypothetical protein